MYPNPKAAIARGYGCNEFVNFGKHKNKTWYDIANAGDYKYLKWCLNYNPNDKRNANGQFKSFFIDDSCFPHISAALQNEKSRSPWVQTFSEPNEEGRCLMKYTSMDDYSVIEGPDIEMKKCPSCNYTKSYLLFNLGNHDLCRYCYTKQNIETSNQVPVAKWSPNMDTGPPPSRKNQSLNYVRPLPKTPPPLQRQNAMRSIAEDQVWP